MWCSAGGKVPNGSCYCDEAQQASVDGDETLRGIETLLYLLHSFPFSLWRCPNTQGKKDQYNEPLRTSFSYQHMAKPVSSLSSPDQNILNQAPDTPFQSLTDFLRNHNHSTTITPQKVNMNSLTETQCPMFQRPQLFQNWIFAVRSFGSSFKQVPHVSFC